jgi:alanine-glyoxylate transaminase / serine-glyoxylate transaminase / serine-pyruvate transaminase
MIPIGDGRDCPLRDAVILKTKDSIIVQKRTFPPHRLLMGPGPSNVHTRVLHAMARPTIGHLDPVFGSIMEEIKTMLRSVFRTENALTIPLSAPGSVGMETCLVNLLEPGDTAIICVNGAFGGRMADIAQRCGAETVVIEQSWGDAVDPSRVEDAFKGNPKASLLAFVHAETSTGVQSDVAALCKIASAHNALSVVDAVTSLGGIPVEVDAWGADAMYSGTQKCLSCPPGLSPLTIGERAAHRIKNRKQPVQSWFMDLGLVMSYWDGAGGRTYHHTAPVNAMYGLHEALTMLLEEGLEASWSRHAAMHDALWAGLNALGLKRHVKKPQALPQLNTVCIPDGLEEAAVRRGLLQNFDIEIGAGLGELAGKVWRVGLMGATARPASVRRFLVSLEQTLGSFQKIDSPGQALVAAEGVLAANA